MAMRRQVLGDAWVDRTLKNRNAFNTEFQEQITEPIEGGGRLRKFSPDELVNPAVAAERGEPVKKDADVHARALWRTNRFKHLYKTNV